MQTEYPIADVQWLTSSAAAEVLARASKLRAAADFSPVRLATQLRKTLLPERARLVMEQVDLRWRAREKFSRPDTLFFTPLGLEQATDEWIAAYKAERFAAGGGLIVDLCCGVGGDAMALLDHGPVVAVDRNDVALVLCEANLRAVAAPERTAPHAARVQQADVAAAGPLRETIAEAAAWHIDPDRRPDGRRTTRVELHEPGIETIRALRNLNANAAIKLSPATTLEGDFWDEAELEWISRARQCRQLVAWFGRLAHDAGKRRATIVFGAPGAVPTSVSFVGKPDVDCAVADRIGRFVFEPDAAVLAAGLQGAIANQYQLAAIAHGVEYFSADQPLDLALLSCFEVLDTMPLDVKRLKAWLKTRHIGRLEVKKRGVEIEPAQLAKQLRVPGDDAATILVVRIQGQVAAIIARRRAVSSPTL